MINEQLQDTSEKSIGFLILIPLLLGSWLLVTSLMEAIPELGVYNGKRILELYLISLTLSLVLLSSQARQRLGEVLKSAPGWIRFLFLVFFGLGVSSALLTANPAYPLIDVAMLFLLPMTAISIACVKHISGNNFDRVVLAFLVLMGFGVIFQELIGMLVYVSTSQQFNYRESLFHFLHPRLYNHIQTWTIPLLALLPLVFTRYRWVGGLSVLLVGTQWYILLSTGARGSTISLLLAMLIVGIIFPASRKFWVKTHISGLVLGILFYVSVIGLLQAVQPDKSDFVSESVGRPMLHTSGRTDLWNHAIDDAIANPWLGTGPMRFACEADHYIAGSPHSFPLQIMGEWGIPAFIILGILFGWLVYSWKRATRTLVKEPDYRHALITCLSISCIAAAIHIWVSGLFIAPASQVAGMLVTGWLLGCLFSIGHASRSAKSTNRQPLLLLLLGVLVSVSVLTWATSELENMPYRTSYAQDYGPITPRFWQDGRFCEYSF